MSSLNKVSVFGSGVLGGQIGFHSAFHGKSVIIYDISAEALERCKVTLQNYADVIYPRDIGASIEDTHAALKRIQYTTDVNLAVQADLIVESVTENIEIKNAVYTQIASLMPVDTILVTNTSSLLPRDFAHLTGRPEKYCALHFSTQMWTRNVIEIMGHKGTSAETLLAVTQFSIEINQLPIPVGKEKNGFVINSWFIPLLQTSMALFCTGVATAEDIDRSFMILNGNCTMGPCGMMDMVGLETCYHVGLSWATQTNDKQLISDINYIKENYIDKGKLGMKSGEGIYSYPNPTYLDANFLSTPDISEAAKIAARAKID